MIITGKLELFRSTFLAISSQCPHFVPPENTRTPKVFWYFQGIKNGNISQKRVKLGESVSISEKCGYVPSLNESFIITNRNKKYFNLPLSTSSWKYQHESRNHIHTVERHYMETLIFKYIYSYLMQFFFQQGFNSSKLFPAVRTFYCISFFRQFVT